MGLGGTGAGAVAFVLFALIDAIAVGFAGWGALLNARADRIIEGSISDRSRRRRSVILLPILLIAIWCLALVAIVSLVAQIGFWLAFVGVLAASIVAARLAARWLSDSEFSPKPLSGTESST